MVAVAQELLGRDVNMLLLAPLGLAYPATALWLLAFGLSRDQRSLETD